MAPDTRVCCNAAMDCSVGSKARSELAASSSSAAARDTAPAAWMKPLRSMSPYPVVLARQPLRCSGADDVPASVGAIRVSLILEYKRSAPEIQRREREFRGDLLWPPEQRPAVCRGT